MTDQRRSLVTPSRGRGGSATASGSLSRLELLRRAALGGAALSIPGLLAACGGDDEETAGTTTGAGGELAGTLRFSNWQLYIDRDAKKKSPSLEQFTAKTGVKVNYVEDVNDNATYFGKIQGPLSQGRGIDRDIIVMTDNSRFPGLLVSKEWVEELDKERIPNLANLIDAQKSPPFDPDRAYSIPWLSGITGLATNMKASGGEVVTTMQQLLEDPKLKGKVTLLTEVADTMSPIMLENGDDPTKVTDESWKKAYDRIQKAVDAGQIRRFTGNDYVADLERGNIAAALSWSGDVATGLAANKALRWNLPEQGSDIWTDNMFIPLEGSVPTASEYMNFVLDPKIAAMIAVGAGYISAVKGVKDEAVKIDPESANNPLIFPDDEILSNVVQFDSAALNNQTYIEQWQQLLGA
jgi:spermidine/putrescine transport system substrate-binding protein